MVQVISIVNIYIIYIYTYIYIHTIIVTYLVGVYNVDFDISIIWRFSYICIYIYVYNMIFPIIDAADCCNRYDSLPFQIASDFHLVEQPSTATAELDVSGDLGESPNWENCCLFCGENLHGEYGKYGKSTKISRNLRKMRKNITPKNDQGGLGAPIL